VITAACAEAKPMGDASVGGGLLASRGGGYELEVLVDGVPAPTFFRGGGTYVLGQMGDRYTLHVVNHTGRRVEAVLSVDGRDVVDGRSADFRGKRGYLVPAYGAVDVDGWRLSNAAVAAFRFSTVAASYAARSGAPRDVGVIGAAIFPERFVPRPRPPRPLEVPYDGALNEPPASSYGRGGGDRGAAEAEAEAPTGARAGDSSSAGAPAPEAAPAKRSRSLADSDSARRPGLGTEFGEAVDSAVREVDFVRANASVPAALLGARYNDRAGLVALGIDVEPQTCAAWPCDHDLELRETATPFPVTERRYAAPPPCWSGRVCP
jgi:hypothetical protein